MRRVQLLHIFLFATIAPLIAARLANAGERSIYMLEPDIVWSGYVTLPKAALGTAFYAPLTGPFVGAFAIDASLGARLNRLRFGWLPFFEHYKLSFAGPFLWRDPIERCLTEMGNDVPLRAGEDFKRIEGTDFSVLAYHPVSGEFFEKLGLRGRPHVPHELLRFHV